MLMRQRRSMKALTTLLLTSTLFIAAALFCATRASSQDVRAPASEKTAGSRISFDVASVKQNKSDGDRRSNVPLTSDSTYYPTGGVFSADDSLLGYILFAYKVEVNESHEGLLRSLPSWVWRDRYDIEAKSENHNPTKDQMRLMMQSLLEDRFKLAVHRETRDVPAFALTLVEAR